MYCWGVCTPLIVIVWRTSELMCIEFNMWICFTICAIGMEMNTWCLQKNYHVFSWNDSSMLQCDKKKTLMV